MNDIHPLQLSSLINKNLDEEPQSNWFANTYHLNQQKIQLSFHAKEETLISGTEVIEALFREVDSNIFMTIYKKNGIFAQRNDAIISFSGSTKSILKAYNLALNFFSRMCGLATLTAKLVQELSQTQAKLLATRQFTPGLKLIEKSAITTGGAHSRTLFLKQGILITRHHIDIAGSLSVLINQLLEILPATIKIEVEICHLNELQETINAGAHSIILKNMSLLDIGAAVDLAQKKVRLEASGHFNLSNIKSIAQTGVEFISTDHIINAYPKNNIYSQINKI